MTAAILRHVARRRGVGQQAANGCVKLAQALVCSTKFPAKRVFPAGIQNNQKAFVLGVFHEMQQFADIDQLLAHIVGIAHLGVHGNQVVAPIHLNTMARVVKNGKLYLGVPHLRAKALHRCAQAGLRGVELPVDLESGTRQQLCHGNGVAFGVVQRSCRVGRVADDQGHPSVQSGRLLRDCELAAESYQRCRE